MKIFQLCDKPEMVKYIAEYCYKEWGYKKSNNSIEKTIEQINKRVYNKKPPITLVAIENDKYIGSVSLKIREMSIYPQKQYWFGDLFIVPEKRKMGIGSKLVKAIEELAISMGITELNLYTPDQEKLYFSLGWNTDEIVQYENSQVVVMSKKLNL